MPFLQYAAGKERPATTTESSPFTKREQLLYKFYKERELQQQKEIDRLKFHAQQLELAEKLKRQEKERLIAENFEKKFNLAREQREERERKARARLPRYHDPYIEPKYFDTPLLAPKKPSTSAGIQLKPLSLLPTIKPSRNGNGNGTGNGKGKN
jgi:hypothetical protein